MTYTEGYDAGLRDVLQHRPRQHPRLMTRSLASDHRRGYDDGWADGEQRLPRWLRDDRALADLTPLIRNG